MFQWKKKKKEEEEEEEEEEGRGAAAGCLLRFLALDDSVSAVAPCARLVLRAPGGACGGGGGFAVSAPSGRPALRFVEAHLATAHHPFSPPKPPKLST